MKRSNLACLALGGLLLGLALVTKPLGDSDAASGAYDSPWLALLIGWGFMATGLLAWVRRPANRTGALMTAVGFAWCLRFLGSSTVPLAQTVGLVGGSLWAGLLIHMFVAFPSGRLRTRAERGVVAAGYVGTTILQIAPLLFAETTSRICCAGNLVVLKPDRDVADALFTLQMLFLVAVVAAASILLFARWRRAIRPQRRALNPILWSGGVTGFLVMLSLAAESAGLKALSAHLDWAYLGAAASMPFAFLVGLLRSRLQRADAVADLVKRLGEAPPAGKLRDALAEALGDPSLMVAYWLPDQGTYGDTTGRPLDLPREGSARAATEIVYDGRRVAAIIHDVWLDEERELVSAAGAAAALGLERERLDAELRARVKELGASRARIVQAGDRERRRLERDLHDGAQQRLVSLLLRFKLARRDLVARPEAGEALLDQVESEIAGAVEELRMLAHGILPPILTDHGLEAAVEELARRSPIAVAVEEMPRTRLPDNVEVAAYFVIAEGLTNVAKYAQVRRARVRAAPADGQVVVEVSDDGVGAADVAAGSGIQGLADRVGALGGRFEVDSRPCVGTTIRAEIPLRPRSEQT